MTTYCQGNGKEIFYLRNSLNGYLFLIAVMTCRLALTKPKKAIRAEWVLGDFEIVECAVVANA